MDMVIKLLRSNGGAHLLQMAWLQGKVTPYKTTKWTNYIAETCIIIIIIIVVVVVVVTVDSFLPSPSGQLLTHWLTDLLIHLIGIGCFR